MFRFFSIHFRQSKNVATLRSPTQRKTRKSGAEASIWRTTAVCRGVFWKTRKKKFTLGKELQQLAPKESYQAQRYQLPLLRKWDCHEFALERPCYFYLNLLLFQKYDIIIVSSWILLIDLIPIKEHSETNYHFCGNVIVMSFASKDHVIFICTCFC